MFRAEILWLANGPILKMDGKLVGDWAEQAGNLLNGTGKPVSRSNACFAAFDRFLSKGATGLQLSDACRPRW